MFTCFLLCIIYRHTHKQEHNKANLNLHSNDIALLEAPLKSAQSLAYLLSGKDKTIQTLRPTHGLDLSLIGVLGGGIAE